MENTVKRTIGTVNRQVKKKGLLSFIGIGPLFILLCVILSFMNPSFLTFQNWINLLNATSGIWIMAMAMTLVLITAGFDLSVGAVLALSGIVLVSLLNYGIPEIVSIIVTLGCITLIGIFTNGILIGKMGLNFFVVTLGTMSLFRGIVYVWSDGKTQYANDYSLLQFIGNGEVGLIPVTVFIMFAMFIFTFILLKYTYFGRSVYVVGGNRETAKLTGIKVPLILMAVYGLSALYASIAGIVEAGRLASASPTIGIGTELLVAAAVLLGGTSFKGGEGGVVGTTLGVLFIGVLQNGLSISGISSYWQSVITGVILIFAILLNQLKTK
ncbi:ABC transporter permease [Siminovitchia acidinfaciens]|uniref:ABC transporter permease n=1 Tax=Siminovitchia acidinfaciens TaxID=2321395 RepID=A0A429Y735_9BACI|nr:ABC transporter permease [Siminovitchia acidinfaciens]RST77193.1 ABC transporter permease [Siminovitchia acidinfaciens]